MHQMTSDWPWTHNGQKYPICTQWLALTSKFCLLWPMNSHGWDTRLSKSKRSELPHIDPKHLSKVHIKLCNCPRCPNWWSVLLCCQMFSRKKVVENHKKIGKIIKWPHSDFEHPTVQCFQLYTGYMHFPRDQKFDLFRSRSSHVPNTSLWKIGNTPNDPIWTFKCQRYPLYTKYFFPWPKFCSVSLGPDHLQDTRLWNIINIVIHQMTSNMNVNTLQLKIAFI